MTIKDLIIELLNYDLRSGVSIEIHKYDWDSWESWTGSEDPKSGTILLKAERSATNGAGW